MGRTCGEATGIKTITPAHLLFHRWFAGQPVLVVILVIRSLPVALVSCHPLGTASFARPLPKPSQFPLAWIEFRREYAGCRTKTKQKVHAHAGVCERQRDREKEEGNEAVGVA